MHVLGALQGLTNLVEVATQSNAEAVVVALQLDDLLPLALQTMRRWSSTSVEQSWALMLRDAMAIEAPWPAATRTKEGPIWKLPTADLS